MKSLHINKKAIKPMRFKHHLIIILALILSACKEKTIKNEQHSIPAINASNFSVFSTENLTTQTFKISCNRDTIIKGKSGSRFYIYKHTFSGLTNNYSDIEIELKEAITSKDIILSGLTTTTNGEILETGGMIYIKAFQMGKELKIRPNMFIGASIPKNIPQIKMKHYIGVIDSDKNINWINPKPLLDLTIKPAKQLSDSTTDSLVPVSSIGEVKYGQLLSDGDTPIYIEKRQASFFVFKRNIVMEKLSKNNELRYRKDCYNASETSYLFEIDKFGWQNIDKKLDGQRVKPIELNVQINDVKKFKFLNVYLTLNKKQIYLIGKIQADKSFSFREGSVPLQLPIGETATLFVIGGKEGNLFVEKQFLTISENQNITVTLHPSTIDNFKKVISNDL